MATDQPQIATNTFASARAARGRRREERRREMKYFRNALGYLLSTASLDELATRDPEACRCHHFRNGGFGRAAASDAFVPSLGVAAARPTLSRPGPPRTI